MTNHTNPQNHTPTPWEAHTEFACRVMAHNVPKGPMTICDIRGWGYLTGKGHGALGLGKDEAIAIQEANTKFIVEACNSHASNQAEIKELKGQIIGFLNREDQHAEELEANQALIGKLVEVLKSACQSAQHYGLDCRPWYEEAQKLVAASEKNNG